MPKFKFLLFAFVASLFLAGCFAETVPVDLNKIENYPTFFMGIWHGIIAPVTFIISVFSDNTAIYQSGGSTWYDFGFLIGISMSFGGGGHGASRARSRKKVHVINM